MLLQDKVAVITGGASGIGEITAKEFAKKGVKVSLCDINQKELERVVDEIIASGGEALGTVANITKEEEIVNLMEKTVNRFGSINIVFANAGIISDGVMINTDKATNKVKSVMSTEQFQKVLDINLTGTFLTLREGARKMVDNNWPGVLIITSSINKVGQVGQLNYASTKAAVALWPKILAGEFQMKGIQHIRIAGIAPGYTGTPILKNMDQNALNSILSDVHIGRLIEPEEIASSIIHIAENDAIDATTIEVTGGVLFGSRNIAK